MKRQLTFCKKKEKKRTFRNETYPRMREYHIAEGPKDKENETLITFLKKKIIIYFFKFRFETYPRNPRNPIEAKPTKKCN